MSEPEYMTGRELKSLLCEINPIYFAPYDDCPFDMQKGFDKLAERIKVPRPPKPKTLEETYVAWRTAGSIANEASLESLRVLLNDARAKLDGGL